MLKIFALPHSDTEFDGRIGGDQGYDCHRIAQSRRMKTQDEVTVPIGHAHGLQAPALSLSGDLLAWLVRQLDGCLVPSWQP